MWVCSKEWASGLPMGVRWKGTPSMWSVMEREEEKDEGRGRDCRSVGKGGSGAGQVDAAGERPWSMGVGGMSPVMSQRAWVPRQRSFRAATGSRVKMSMFSGVR